MEALWATAGVATVAAAPAARTCTTSRRFTFAFSVISEVQCLSGRNRVKPLIESILIACRAGVLFHPARSGCEIGRPIAGSPRTPGLIERARIIHRERRVQRLAAIGDAKAFDHMQLRRMRRAVS